MPAVGVDVQRILTTLWGHECLLEAELFALVDEVLTRQAEQQKSRRFGAFSTETVAAQSRHVPAHVVVRLRPARQ